MRSLWLLQVLRTLEAERHGEVSKAGVQQLTNSTCR